MGQARRDEKRDPMVVGVCEGVEVHDHISESGTGIDLEAVHSYAISIWRPDRMM
jgi:hypothetical protein